MPKAPDLASRVTSERERRPRLSASTEPRRARDTQERTDKRNNGGEVGGGPSAASTRARKIPSEKAVSLRERRVRTLVRATFQQIWSAPSTARAPDKIWEAGPPDLPQKALGPRESRTLERWATSAPELAIRQSSFRMWQARQTCEAHNARTIAITTPPAQERCQLRWSPILPRGCFALEYALNVSINS